MLKNSLVILFIFIAFSCDKKPKIKNVILLIGDGMGIQQLNLGNLYLAHAPGSEYKKKQLSLFKHSKHLSLSLTKPHNNLVVDSACSATQLATGVPAISETIGLDIDGGKPQTIIELANNQGMSTALISNTRLTHATPASFAARTTSRYLENEIAELMLETEVDIMISGGLRNFIPADHAKNKKFQNEWRSLIDVNYTYSSKRKDNKNLLQTAKDKGYKVSFTPGDYFDSEKQRHLVFLNNSAMSSAIDLAKDAISIPEITAKTLTKLAQNTNGFFMMVEEGQIDWAGHANDAGSMLHEVLQMDRTFEAIHKWASKRDDTLIIVTADHETGGFGFSYKVKNLPKKVAFPGLNYKDRMFEPQKNFGDYDQLDLIYNQKESYNSSLHRFMNDEPDAQKLCQVIFETSKIQLEEKVCVDVWAQAKEIIKQPSEEVSNDFHKEYVHSFTASAQVLSVLVGRAIAPYLNTTWGTGSHTSTPVGVFVWGPDGVEKKFAPIMTHPQLGQVMQEFIKQE